MKKRQKSKIFERVHKREAFKTCSECKGEMKVIDHAGVKIDRCSSCNGQWFDKNEAEELKNITGSEEVDKDQDVDYKVDISENAVCPRCDIEMNLVIYPGTTKLFYEKCPSCEGLYFDVGEFRKYKNIEISPFLKDLLNK